MIALLGQYSSTLDGRDGTTWFYKTKDGGTLRVFFYAGKASLQRQR